jgi:hypothetical protein
MLCRFLFICSCVLSSTILKAQDTVTQIDSICNEVDAGKNSCCTIACGPVTSRENCYTCINDEILLSSNGFIILRDTLFSYNYHFLNNKPIKVILSLEHPVNNKIFTAIYYFSNDKVLKAIGEDLKISDAELSLSYAKAHTYWFPKKVVLKNRNKRKK